MLTFCLILCSLTSFCTCTTTEATFSLDVCCQTWHSRYESTPSIFFNWNKIISRYDYSNETKYVAETPLKLFEKFQKHRDKIPLKITLPETKSTRCLPSKTPQWLLLKLLLKFYSNTFEFVYITQNLNPVSVNPTKWSNTLTLKQFVSNTRRIVGVCLTFLLGWRLMG